jgi:hypothetical protein
VSAHADCAADLADEDFTVRQVSIRAAEIAIAQFPTSRDRLCASHDRSADLAALRIGSAELTIVSIGLQEPSYRRRGMPSWRAAYVEFTQKQEPMNPAPHTRCEAEWIKSG